MHESEQDSGDHRGTVESLCIGEAALRTFAEHVSDAFFLFDTDGVILDVNHRACKNLGYTREELIGMNSADLDMGGSHDPGKDACFDTSYRRKDGSMFPAEVRIISIRESGTPLAMVLVRDVTEHQQMEGMLRRLNRELIAISSCTRVLMRATNEQELFDNICRTICDTAGYHLAWVGLAEHDEAKTVKPMAQSGFEEGYLDSIDITWADTTQGRGPTGTAIRTGVTQVNHDFLTNPLMAPWREEARKHSYHSSIALPLKKGADILGCLSIYAVEPDAFAADEVGFLEELADNLAFGIDVLRMRHQRMQADDEREKLQAQLIQAQKMESIGRLAGGIAHDFNNILSAIVGYTELAMRDGDTSKRLAHLEEVQKAANRSVDLTRQLLAFARKQTVLPKVVDLNEIVTGMLGLLQGMIGEGIDLVWQPGTEIWPVRVDPTQIDQILANLCVNARDALAGGGTISIETRNAPLDEVYAASHPGAVPGNYVLLFVGDNGHGMSSETLDHVFEPFFTTKDVGKGTGLGLATVYGIVKQNNGYIDINSEQGQGTTASIYLPRYTGEAERVRTAHVEKTLVQGHETILIVEDEPVILEIAKLVLEKSGYRVIAASLAEEAMRLAREYGGEIHLLITDIVMPEMNGRELAEQMLSLYPGMRCLYMSGYSGDTIAQQGVLDEGVHFIQKPFSTPVLAAKVRQVLDGE